MKLVVGTILACLITVGAALVEGNYSRRFTTVENSRNPVESIELLPAQIGEWRSLGDNAPLPEYVRRELGLMNSLDRSYEHSQTKQIVQVLLMVGEPGPLVRHPPSVCYANRAHKQIGSPEWLQSKGESEWGRFQLLRYEPSGALANERFYVAYAHTSDGDWDVPKFPRIAYGGQSRLFKAQVLATKSGIANEQAVLDGLTQFTDQFSRAFEQHIIANAAATMDTKEQ